jgi:hypothetical protein
MTQTIKSKDLYSIGKEYSELFREFTEDELKICPYPDIGLQDEVMRMTN